MSKSAPNCTKSLQTCHKLPQKCHNLPQNVQKLPQFVLKRPQIAPIVPQIVPNDPIVKNYPTENNFTCLRAEGAKADITGSIYLTILPIWLTQSIMFCCSFQSLCSNHSMWPVWTIMFLSPRWYTSIFDGLVLLKFRFFHFLSIFFLNFLVFGKMDRTRVAVTVTTFSLENVAKMKWHSPNIYRSP